MTLSASPTPVNAYIGKVQRLTLKVIPGYACKVYIGQAGFVKESLTGVYAVLFPNSTGGHSEEFTVVDPRGTDGVDLATIYVASDCPGEKVSMFYFQTGNLSASVLRFFGYGALIGYPPACNSLYSGPTTLAAFIRVQVIPGQTGKVSLGNLACSTFAVLYPNSGNPAQHNGHSEKFYIEDKWGQLRPDLIRFTPDVGTEGLLILMATYS